MKKLILLLPLLILVAACNQSGNASQTKAVAAPDSTAVADSLALMDVAQDLADLLNEQIQGGTRNAALAPWETYSQSDPMSDETTTFAFSKGHGPFDRVLEFPNNDTICILIYWADDNPSVSFVFQPAINFRFRDGTDRSDATGDRQNLAKVRIRWDDEEPSTITLYEAPGDGNHIAFVYGPDADFIEQLKSHDELMIEFPLYGEGNVLWKFLTSDAARAIEEAHELHAVG